MSREHPDLAKEAPIEHLSTSQLDTGSSIIVDTAVGALDGTSVQDADARLGCGGTGGDGEVEEWLCGGQERFGSAKTAQLRVQMIELHWQNNSCDGNRWIRSTGDVDGV